MRLRDLYESVGKRPDFRMLAALVDRWRWCAGDKDLPSYTDLECTDLGSLAGHVFLIDVSRPPFRFRIRQTGARIDAIFGRCDIGRGIDDPDAQYFEAGNVDDYACAAINQRPHFTCGQAVSISGVPTSYMRLLLPLSSDGMSVDMILGGVVTSMTAGPTGSDEHFLENAAELLSAVAN